MARDYAKETQWEKEKYTRTAIKLDSNEYGLLLNKVKEDMGVNEFMRRALKLYETNPNLFEKKD